MKAEYDYVYLTNTPSFYKLNLCHKLGEEGLRGLLVFYGYGAEAVNTALNDAAGWKFDFRFLNEGDSNSRSRFSTFRALIRLMRGIRTGKVIYSGWLSAEYNIYSFMSLRRKNVMTVESTIYESSTKGFKGWIKRRIVKRMSGALPSGIPHRELLGQLGFRDKLAETGSVGIFRKPGRPLMPHQPADDFRYLYVGRLIECKNLEFLVSEFIRSGRQLTIAGDGHLRHKLESMAQNHSNIRFVGFVDNSRIQELYSQHDIFVLPSISEPWGLVVEEALYAGLPVIVSDHVGCGPDMVDAYGSGIRFTLGDADDFSRACEEVEKNYAKFALSVAKINFDQRERCQLDAYHEVLRP